MCLPESNICLVMLYSAIECEAPSSFANDNTRIIYKCYVTDIKAHNKKSEPLPIMTFTEYWKNRLTLRAQCDREAEERNKKF